VFLFYPGVMAEPVRRFCLLAGWRAPLPESRSAIPVPRANGGSARTGIAGHSDFFAEIFADIFERPIGANVIGRRVCEL
jgi:hypothetical protein